MSISVIVATYGDREWDRLAWERAVPSVKAQYPDEAHAVTVHDEIGTIASSRNEGAEIATGDWLCFLDADDELAPGYIGAMEAAVERNPGGRVLLTPAVQQVRRGRPGQPFFYPECSLTTGNWLVIGTLISRELFWEVGGFDDHPHGLEDWQLWAKCVKAGATIVKVPEAVYVAHTNAQSKHRQLMRDRRAYADAYEAARASVWG